MTTQRDLFLPAVATVRTRQGDLYDRLSVQVGLSCSECGRPMIETASGFASCPMGHGRLRLDRTAPDEPGGLF